MKIYYMGKEIRSKYPKATKNGKYSRTRFQLFKDKIIRWYRWTVRMIRIALYGTAVVSTVFALGAIIWNQGQKSVIPLTAQAEVIDNSASEILKRIDVMKGDVVNQVSDCERGGHVESEGYIKMDSNNVFSYGTLQFQKKTVIFYYKALYGKEINGKEAIEIMMDDVKAKALAKDIMFKSKNKSWDWANCTRWHDIEVQIDAIKRLETNG